ECMSPESLTGVPCPSAPRGETARGKEFASFFFFKTNWTYQARSARDMRARRCACPRLSGRCRVGLHQAHSIHPGHPDLHSPRARVAAANHASWRTVPSNSGVPAHSIAVSCRRSEAFGLLANCFPFDPRGRILLVVLLDGAAVGAPRGVGSHSHFHQFVTAVFACETHHD